MQKLFLTSTILSLFASVAAAQGALYHIPSNTPTTGTCNVIPFGTQNSSTTWRNQRYQTMATAADLGNSQVLNICDLAFSRCNAGDMVTHFDSIEIVMGQTSAASLSGTFATNLASNVQTVLSAKNYDWHTTGNTWDRIGLDKSYTYIAAQGANLVVQITVTGAHQASTSGFHRDTRQRVYRYGWTGTPPATGTAATGALKWQVVVQSPDLGTFGVGCQGSNNQTPKLAFTGSAQLGGTGFSIDVSNCLPTAVSLHVIGLTRYPTGINLSLIGAPGCMLYQTTDFIIGQVANGSGAYSMKFLVPNDRNLACQRIYTQAFPLDQQANNWGRTASNYGRILPGF